ncbi:cobalt-zinc-cadmium efflux system outer membrane protein [Parvibaculum indicum]|uniref:TolC family protein n=1 Tax=Parvibaculum indicum TaxID=562969 RepID=UPI00141EB006|nr:TolC family protein [Parvibaculum indicum]NIJ42275.1 cobalt-zinc-cadmium efflux system outer membrane protein [Parvibaculum indicum]
MKCQKLALFGAVIASLWLVEPGLAEESAAPDIALREFVFSVLSDHPALRQAQAELDAARAQARGQAQPLYNPEIELEYEEALDNSKSVGLSQTLDLSGKRRARANVATAEVVAAEARFAITRKTLLANLLIALSDYQARRDAVRIAEQRVRLDEEFLALAERRNRAGDLPQSDLLTARLTLAEARAAASTASIEFSQAEERLIAVVGGVMPPPPPLTGSPPQKRPSIEVVNVDALPELQSAQADTEAARAFVSVAKRNRIPDPTLGVKVGEARSALDPLGQRESSTLFGIRLSIPLPIRNTYSAEVDAARAGSIAREQSYRDLRRRVEARLAASLRRYETALGAWQAWTAQGAAPLDEQRALLQRLWEAGEVGAVDYIIQLNQTFATESAGVELKGRLWATWFDWLEASAAISEWVENIQ